MTGRPEPWGIVIDQCRWLWFGRRLRVVATLVNHTSVATIPDARRLRATLRDVRGHALANSEIYRPDEGQLTVYRPVVQPQGAVQVCFQFERLPDDRAPASLTVGGEAVLLPPLAPAPLRRRDVLLEDGA